LSLFFKSFLNVHNLLLFDSELAADLRDLMFELFFKLYDSLLASLKINSFPANLLLELSDLTHAFHELSLSFSLLGLPLSRHFFDSLELSLLKPSFEFLFLSSFPELELPDNLLSLINASIWTQVFLTSKA
jgi:hypothetical protein